MPRRWLSRLKAKSGAQTRMRGFWDIEVCANGQLAYIEVKSAKGTLSDYQQLFKASRKRHGWAKFLVARSKEDVVLFLRVELGIPLMVRSDR